MEIIAESALARFDREAIPLVPSHFIQIVKQTVADPDLLVADLALE